MHRPTASDAVQADDVVADAPARPRHAAPGTTARRTTTRRTLIRRATDRLARLWWLGLAVLGGLGLDAAFAPLAWWPIAIPAAAAVMLAAYGRTWKAGLLVGLAAGLAQFLPLIFWLHVVTPLAWVALAIAEAVYIAFLGAGLTSLVGRVPGWPLWAACWWVAQEAVRSRWPLDGFGWGRLAFSQPDTPYTGFAALAGAPLVTFAVALSAGLLAATVLAVVRRHHEGGRRRAPARGPIVAAACAVGVVAIPILGAQIPRPTDGPTIQVAIVQGNVPHPGTHFLGRAEQVLDNHLAQTADLANGIADGQYAQPSIVIWPENATDTDPLKNPTLKAKIQAATQAVDVPILVGAVLDHGRDNVTNTGIVWDPVTGPGGPNERYTKRHLVPFGEYVPFRGVVSHLTSLTTLVPRNFVPGHTDGALDIGPTRIADVMCFEIAFDDVVRSGVTHGGKLIVVQTNNATYMGTAETRQQLAMSQLRAVEHGRSVVVAATSGISAVIAPDGHVVTQTAEMTPAIIDLPVTQRTQLTLADHLGVAPEWVIGILGVLAVAAAIASAAVGARRRPAHADSDSEARR